MRVLLILIVMSVTVVVRADEYDPLHESNDAEVRTADFTVSDAKHHRVILALSTAFWDAFLKEDATAREWLNGPGSRSGMQNDDRWQRKKNEHQGRHRNSVLRR